MELEDLIKKIYSLCYRLTGDNQLAQKLCSETLESWSKDKMALGDEEVLVKTALKTAKLFLQKYGSHPPKRPHVDDPLPRMQQGFNSLPLEEKLVVVLHDVFQISLLTIVNAFHMQDINRLLHQGRIRLKQQNTSGNIRKCPVFVQKGEL